MPALRALTEAFPEHRRVLAAPGWLRPLVALMGGWELEEARPLAPLARRPGAPDIAVNLHGRGPESHRVLLALRPGRLVAFAHPAVPETAGAPPFRTSEHEVERWCRLLTESDIPADPALVDIEAPVGTAPDAGVTVLHPGAASGARRWPAERWSLLAAREHAAGRRVVLTGSPAERPLARGIAEAARLPADVVAAGTTDVGGLARIIAGAGRVVTGDTGAAHLATALRRPSVVLFGPVSPREWGPPVDRPWHRVLWAGTVGDPHADRVDPGLLAITVDDVVRALADLPAAQPAAVAVPA